MALFPVSWTAHTLWSWAFPAVVQPFSRSPTVTRTVTHARRAAIRDTQFFQRNWNPLYVRLRRVPLPGPTGAPPARALWISSLSLAYPPCPCPYSCYFSLFLFFKYWKDRCKLLQSSARHFQVPTDHFWGCVGVICQIMPLCRQWIFNICFAIVDIKCVHNYNKFEAKVLTKAQIQVIMKLTQ